MPILRRTLAAVVLLALFLPCGRVRAATPVAAPEEDLVAGPAAGPWRRLFLDAMVVERQEGLSRVFHAATKHPANPVLPRDKPWEQIRNRSGPYLYGTILWDEGKLRMWYHSGGYRNLYAESADGVTWHKPELGLVEFEGSKANNLFLWLSDKDAIEEPELYRGGSRCHNPSVIKRPWEPDPEKRYALFSYSTEYRRARVAYSADGLNWTFDPETARKGLFGTGDVMNVFWDPYRSRYVATVKTGSRRGRSAGAVTSPDGRQWTNVLAAGGPVFVPDDLDPDATQIYGMPVFPYQGMYLGLPWIYNARWFKYGRYTDQRMGETERDSPCTVDAQLAWSWDLISWTRTPERRQFIPRGAEGEFDSGMIYTARAPVQVGDKLYFYYGGFNGPHNTRDRDAEIGLATLRLDGFCSMQAGAEEGWLISRREPLAVPKVTINARTEPDGYVVAELLDTNNEVVPGFSREECVPFTGDAVAHVLTWTMESLPESHREGDKKFRFYLKDAHMYSYLPDPTPPPDGPEE